LPVACGLLPFARTAEASPAPHQKGPHRKSKGSTASERPEATKQGPHRNSKARSANSMAPLVPCCSYFYPVPSGTRPRGNLLPCLEQPLLLATGQRCHRGPNTKLAFASRASVYILNFYNYNYNKPQGQQQRLKTKKKKFVRELSL